MKSPEASTLHGVLRQQARDAGDVPAVIAGGRTLSYADLAESASRIAALIQVSGAGAGKRVGLLAGNSAEWLEVAFGAFAAGATLVPFSTWSTRDELAYLLVDSQIDMLFTAGTHGDRSYIDDLKSLVRDSLAPHLSPANIVLLDGQSDGFSCLREAIDGIDADDGLQGSDNPEDIALILYTSGSSARPKAVPLLHRGLVENGFNIGERQGLRRGDRILLAPPLFWSYASANALPAAFTHGSTLVLQERFRAAEAIALIEEWQCTGIYTMPVMTNAILADPAFAPGRLSTLRTGLTIGTAQDVINAAEGLGAAEICNVYGATETYGNCCVTWHHWSLAKRAESQGEPLPGNEIRLIHPETGNLVEQGEAGLVEVRGYITRGYVNDSAAHNGPAFTDDGFYRTGDIASIDVDGALHFIGRATEMIKRAGINVSPAEVEEILLRHPAVRQAGVIGMPDEKRGEAIVAFVVVDDPRTSPRDLLEHCRKLSSKYKVPDLIAIRDDLPLTSTGKIKRLDLKPIARAMHEHARADA